MQTFLYILILPYPLVCEIAYTCNHLCGVIWFGTQMLWTSYFDAVFICEPALEKVTHDTRDFGLLPTF